ncbi:acyltransferase [Flavobacterium jejuense]|uniref:Acyltransferase n=1 Tax=Flavobacterium jejuense TaxID=1544455 RepID=A0ABX0ILM7_9FLAO|nr:MBOAT family O-acyltransferase [Flavobacterium jejuense]NHN24486.1 acyltransferase [Flavobacterium jejuense]
MNITLSQYIIKRNGVPIGSSKSLRNNLYRSLGAKNFSTFWKYWNPIFGYYLGKFIFKPLKKSFSVSISLIFTFVFCGFIHDIVTTIVRGKTNFFFTTWFFIMSLIVLLSKMLKHDFSKQNWIIRACINLLLISGSFVLTNHILNI